MPRYDARPRLESGALVFRATFRSGDQGYRPEPGAATVEFSCALDGIDRDTDGDGLTDVLEDWYVTDPASRDTDRDGLSDDVDAMPHVPVTGTPTLRGRALLQAHLEWRQKHGTIRADVGPPQWPGINAAHGDTFIVSSRKDLRGLAPGRRLFVLTAAEAEQARARFGGSHPASGTSS